MIAVKEIAFTCYPVTDMTRSRAFYEGVLGLKPTTVSESGGGSWAEYEIGAGAFAIGRMVGWEPSSGGATVAFEVEDFDAAIAKLKAAKVSFTMEPISTPVCRMASITDPDGSPVTVHKRRAS